MCESPAWAGSYSSAALSEAHRAPSPGATRDSTVASLGKLPEFPKVQFPEFANLAQAIVAMNREMLKSVEALTQGPARQVDKSMKAINWEMNTVMLGGGHSA